MKHYQEYKNVDASIKTPDECHRVYKAIMAQEADANAFALHERAKEIRSMGEKGASELVVKLGIWLAQNTQVNK